MPQISSCLGRLDHGQGAWTILGAPKRNFLGVNIYFFVFLGVCFHIRCLGTCE